MPGQRTANAPRHAARVHPGAVSGAAPGAAPRAVPGAPPRPAPYRAAPPRPGAAAGRSTGRHAAPSAARRVGTTTVAAGAAFGVVASGAFAAIVPTTVDGHSSVADASAETPTTMMAAQPVAMETPAASGGGSAYFSPVAFESVDSASTGAKAAAADLAAAGKAGKIAQNIAAEHAKAAAAEKQRKAARSTLDKKIAAGGLDGWVAEALDHMGMSQDYAPALKKIILKESNGDPDAINDWDSNAAAGNPSEGLMQVIPSTFEKYVHPDFADRDPSDPVANITAGVRYMVDRYGEETLAAGGRSSSSGGYLGY